VEVGYGPTRILESLGRKCHLVERSSSDGTETDSIAGVNRQLARAVASHRGAPVVLAGNCNSCLGTLAGLARDDVGIVWFDAHGDFNTPQTTVSGKIEGMSLAIATGGCHEELRQRIGLIRPVPEESVLLVAARDLDPGEATRLDHSAVTVVQLPDLEAGLDRLASRVAAVYVHLDIDVINREESPGVNCTAPGGISPEQLHDAIRRIGARIPIAAAAIANFNPARDRDDRTLRIAYRLVDILNEVSLS
jgi:arginase